MKCSWKKLAKGSRCISCGYILKRDYSKPPVRECPAGECRYFLGATRETVLVFGCGCASAKTEGVPVTVCECELQQHPRCIVFSRGELPAESGVVRCDQCLDRIY